MKNKKLLPIAVLAALILGGCAGNTKPSTSRSSSEGSTTASETSSQESSSSSESESSSSSESIQYGVAITNKSALQADEWYNGVTRELDIELTPEGNVTLELSRGNLTIVSSNPAVVSVQGLALTAESEGEATITVTYHGETDTVAVTTAGEEPVAPREPKDISEIIAHSQKDDQISFDGVFIGETNVRHYFNKNADGGVHPYVYFDDGTGAMLAYQIKDEYMTGLQVGDVVAVDAVYSPYNGLPETKSQTAVVTKLTDKAVTPQAAIAIGGENHPALAKADANRKVVITEAEITKKSVSSDGTLTYTIDGEAVNVNKYTVEIQVGEQKYSMTVREKYCDLSQAFKDAVVGDKISCTSYVNVNGSTVDLVHALDVTITAGEFDPITGLTINGDSEVEVEKSINLTVTPIPATANSAVTWSSSDDTKATVDQTGKVTGVAAGEVTITATSKVDANVKATKVITVKEAEVLNYGSLAEPLSVDEAKVVLDKTGNKNWTKEKVYVKGIVTEQSTEISKAAGEKRANIWLASDDGSTAKAFELYSAYVDDSLDGYAANALVGKEIIGYGWGELYNTTYELTNKDAAGNYDNPLVMSVADVVAPAATAVKLNKTTAELEAGEQLQLTASLTPATSQDTIVWSSDAEAVATVDQTGKVVAVAEGEATITAAVSETVKATCVVTVSAASTETKYTIDVSDSAWPTASEAEPTAHTIGGVALKTCGLNKDTSANAQAGGDIFMAKAAGYFFNTTSLGTIKSIKITISSKSSAGKYLNVVLGKSAIETRNTESANAHTFAKEEVVEITNEEEGVGYFNISNNQTSSGKNIRIVKVVIVYEAA